MAPVPRSQRRALQLQCEWNGCNEVLTTTQSFTEHLMNHAEEFIAGALSVEKCLADVDENDTDDYQCQWVDCGYVTNEGSAALLRHLLFHGYHARIKWAGTVERERCKVEPCQLETHSRNIIPEVPSSFVCSWEDCSFVTNNPDYFYCHCEMHSQMEEPVKGSLACRWRDCQVKTKDKYKLRDHLRSHSQEKRFGCSQCGGLFSNRTKFFDHIHRQGILDEPNYQCSHCSKVFASERLLRDHMRHHVNHYKCPFCDMTCPAPSVLKKHITWRHSTDRPFTCELCGHGAKTRTDMRRHMESHNAGDAYTCDIENCAFTAKTISTLRSHFRKCHSDLEDKRYMCHVCQSKFTRGTILTTHLKVKHHFKWPSGHVRFRYKEHEDGYLRLQIVRYESIELTQQILQETSNNAPPTGPPMATPTAPPTGTPAPPTTMPTATLTATPLSKIQEEEVGGANLLANQKAEKSKSSKKRKSSRIVTPRKRKSSRNMSPNKRKATKIGSPNKEKKTSSETVGFVPSQVQYVDGEQGPIIIVDCTLDLKTQEGLSNRISDVINSYENVINKQQNNSTEGNNEDYDVASHEGGGDHAESASQPIAQDIQFVSVDGDGNKVISSSQTIAKSALYQSTGLNSTSTVMLESGGYPISHGQYYHEVNSADMSNDHQSPPIFPIEQLQGFDGESGSDREQTPKKAGFEPISIAAERSVVSSEGDEIRTRCLDFEDDRMADAVEAMTNLSRGH